MVYTSKLRHPLHRASLIHTLNKLLISPFTTTILLHTNSSHRVANSSALNLGQIDHQQCRYIHKFYVNPLLDYRYVGTDVSMSSHTLDYNPTSRLYNKATTYYKASCNVIGHACCTGHSRSCNTFFLQSKAPLLVA